MHSKGRDRKFTVKITVLEATLTKNVATFGSMSPFCQLKFGSATFTTACSNGNRPKWNEMFRFEEVPQTPLCFTVYHKAMLFGQSEVGRCSVKIPPQQFDSTKTFNLSNGSEGVGTILVSISVHDVTGRNFSNGDEFMAPSKGHPGYTSYGKLPHSAGSFEEVKGTKGDDNKNDLTHMKREVTEQNDCLKQQEEKIKKSVDKIRYEQAVIKKQKTEIRQAQEGTIYAKQKIIDLGRLRIMLNNERSEIQMEKEDLCQERVNLEQLKQEVGEIQQKSEEDTKALEEEKLTLVQLQSELYEKSKALDTETYELGEKEIFNLRQDALLMLKERLISRVYERKVLSIEKYQENSQQRKITDKATPVHEIDEDSNLTNEKAKPRALSGINSKSETETLRDEQESLVNASGISIITANFPSSRGLSILKKEQELEEQMKMLEEEKRKLRAEKEMIDKEKEEVEFIKAQIEKEAERGKPFSFAKYEEEKKNDLFPAAKEVKLEEVEQKEMEDQDELDFKPDPSILEKINENITKGNALFEQQPSSTIEPQFSEEQFSSEGPIVRVSLGKSISVDETKSPDKDWNDDAIRSGLMFRSHSEDSSEESIIIKEDKVYDEPKRAKYGIRPLVPNS